MKIKNGMILPPWVILLGITFLIVAMFALFTIAVTQAYSYNDYYENREDPWSEEEDINERGDDDAVGYYDYPGQWHEIPEPDPYYPVSYGYGYGYSRSHRSLSPISMMMPLFIVFFLFLPWLAYALSEE